MRVGATGRRPFHRRGHLRVPLEEDWTSAAPEILDIDAYEIADSRPNALEVLIAIDTYFDALRLLDTPTLPSDSAFALHGPESLLYKSHRETELRHEKAVVAAHALGSAVAGRAAEAWQRHLDRIGQRRKSKRIRWRKKCIR